MSIIGLTRIRNEQTIITDTLDHFSRFCDGGILVYDDCSDDDSVSLCRQHKSVLEVIEGDVWSPDRINENSRHRHILLKKARSYKPDWFLLFDADERIEWDFAGYENYDSVVMKLWDYYITPEDADIVGMNRKWMGPEYRRILMMFRNEPYMRYHYRGQRIVDGFKNPLYVGEVRHYGKAISVEEWEKTCDYYSNFPEPFKSKWQARKGKAVHLDMKSDFGNPLITWEERHQKGFEKEGLPKYRAMQIPYEIGKTTAVASYPENLRTSPPFRILLCCDSLEFLTADETSVYTLATTLQSRGHEVTVITTVDGFTGDQFRERGIDVLTDFERIYDRKFDLIHAFHNLPALLARHHFPATPIIYQSNNILTDSDRPPSIDIGIYQYLVNSPEAEIVWKETYGISNVETLPLMVDCQRFTSTRPIHTLAKKVLLISNHMIKTGKKVVEEACAISGLELTTIGAANQIIWTVETEINKADIVISTGRGAVEAMACGRAVFLYDWHGGEGWMTEEDYQSIAFYNFSGRNFRREYTGAVLAEELARYSSDMGESNHRIAKKHHDASKIIEQIEEIYSQATGAGEVKQYYPVPAAEIAYAQQSVFREAQMKNEVITLSQDNKKLQQEIANLKPKIQMMLKKVQQEKQLLEEEITRLRNK